MIPDLRDFCLSRWRLSLTLLMTRDPNTMIQCFSKSGLHSVPAFVNCALKEGGWGSRPMISPSRIPCLSIKSLPTAYLR